MATNLGNEPYNVFPMGTQKVDGNGDLWFFSNRISNHFEDIQLDSKVQITYIDEAKQEYLSILGDAVPIIDTDKVDELWSPLVNRWFEGKTDPNLVLLKAKILEARHWDSETNQMVSLVNEHEILV